MAILLQSSFLQWQIHVASSNSAFSMVEWNHVMITNAYDLRPSSLFTIVKLLLIVFSEN